MIAHYFSLAVILPFVTGRFTNPPEIIRGTFRLGDRQTIKYDTTFTNYTIALWQQAPEGGAAKLGPILFETNNGPGSTFDWLVQAYDFNIDDSPTFFMWLFLGGSANQGNGSIPNMVSSYFTIARPVTTSSQAPSSSPSSPLAISPSTPSSTFISLPSSSPSLSSSNPPAQGTNSSSGGLSAGASAGIGIGVGLGVVIVAAVLGLIFWKRRKNKKRQQQASSMHAPQYEAYPNQEIPHIVEASASKSPAELG
ncbi:hypothetical protein PT974_10214 [Cladobotryum mycophilum]|uniref:Mid2 domain-containing protein n=1 Tax=Cladobotryum mycophilum TaxID=491253 RepID=A0ABR0SAA7_9HYPO